MLSSNFHSIRQAWSPSGAPSALVSWGWETSTSSGRELLSQDRECLGSWGGRGHPYFYRVRTPGSFSGGVEGGSSVSVFKSHDA